MDLEYKLNDGVLETIMNGGTFPDPVVQVLGSKKMIRSVKDNERYRLLLSDGKYKVNIAMYTVPLNNQLIVNALEEYSVIKLKRYVSNVIKTKENRDTRVLLVLELELVVGGNVVGHVIGDPTILTDQELSSQSSDLSITQLPQMPRNRDRFKLLSNARIISPISSLNPFHNNWIIKARVVNKTNVRNWSNAKGEGKLFSVELVDESGGIKCTAFREHVDKFFDQLEVDNVYYVSKCILRPINRQFCTLKHEFEMIFTPVTVIEESKEDNGMIPQSKYNFTTIDKIAVMVAGTLVDVVAICKKVSEIQNFVSKTTNREFQKREIFLMDPSRTSISLVVWGTDAEAFQAPENSIIAIKNAKIHEFQSTKSISMTAGSQLRVNPNIPETQKLREWYDSEGYQIECRNVSARSGIGGKAPWMTFKEVHNENLAQQEAGFYFQTLGTIIFVRLDRAVYKSCPSSDCQKKVMDLENGMYRCEKCNREYRNFQYRLLIMMNVSDATGNQWVTVFSSEAEKILGKTALEIGESIENNSESVAKLFEEAQFKQFVFKCRAKIDSYNDERRLKVIVVGVNSMNYEEHNGYLISRIEKYRAIPKN